MQIIVILDPDDSISDSRSNIHKATPIRGGFDKHDQGKLANVCGSSLAYQF
ncbi:MAG: hypothetical protein R3C05_23710 [Pirellulaceae bacterium]